MALHDALTRLGYTFRRHLEEEGWTKRKLTVVDLTPDQRAALDRGGVAGLREALSSDGLWAFPSLDIERPLPARRGIPLSVGAYSAACIVAPLSQSHLADLARRFREAVERSFGVHLVLHDDRDAGLDLLRVQPVVLFGGAHESRLAVDFALRYQTGFLDATVPGEGGFAVTTHAGLDASGHNVVQVAASASTVEEACRVLLEAVSREGDRVVLRHTHRIVPGPDMRRHLPSWDAFAASLPARLPGNRELPAEVPVDPGPLSRLLAAGLDSGGPDVNLYNAAPVDIAIDCARYYQLTGEHRALLLFRELLFRLADYYLKTPEGASYIADLDFRIGSLALYWGRMEHESLFTDDDRLVLSALLLSCVHSCYEYALKIWPVAPDGPTRHNHETFPARSLLFAADYFARHGAPQTDAWLTYANTVFSGGIWSRFKQRENAHTYEQTAYEHAACYSAFTGRRLDLFQDDCLRKAAGRVAIATDNFFRPVDYGDTSIHVKGGVSDVLSILVTSRAEDPVLQWYAGEAFARQHHYMSSPIHGIPGLRLGRPGAPPSAGEWERMPLDPQFLEEKSPGFPAESAFDMLAFRSGWSDDDHYLLFEGVGNRKVSHSHNEVNGLVRLNHLGRHWIVSNGYGRRAGLSNVNVSFNTRVLGPEDHNMLVYRRGGDIVRDLPVCSALLQCGRQESLLWATGALLNYAGTDWFRTFLLLPGRALLVVDRIHVVADGLESAHVEWNALGDAERTAGGFRLAQQGVFLDVLSASGWAPKQGVADQSADWKRVLESDAYPYAAFPLKKLLFQAPTPVPGQDLCLATLLAATRSAAPAFAIAGPSPGHIRLESLGGPLPALDMADQDLSLKTRGAALDIRFAVRPPLPSPLTPWSAACAS